MARYKQAHASQNQPSVIYPLPKGQRLLEYLVVFVVFLGLSTFLFWKILRLPPGNMLFGLDTHSFFYYIFDYFVKTITLAHEIPFWNPYTLSGTPALANPAGGSLYYPGNIIFFLFPLSQAFFIHFLTHFILTGTTMFWFSRKYLDFLSSCAASIVLTFSGYMIGSMYMGHIESVAVMAWLPLVFGSFVDFISFQSRRSFILATSALTLQILAGTYIAVLFTLELLTLFVIGKCSYDFLRVRSWNRVFSFLLRSSLVIVLATGLSAIALIPFFELSRLSIRSVGLPFESASGASLNWNLLSIFFDPVTRKDILVMDPSSGEILPQNLNLEFLFFMGRSSILILIGSFISEVYRYIRYKKLNTLYLFCLGTLGIFILLAMGRNFPLYKLLYSILTPYRLIRRPVRHLMIATFLLSYLTGYALSRISKRFLQMLLVSIISLELLYFGKNYILVNPEPPVYNDKKLIQTIQERIGTNRVYLNYRSSEVSQLTLYENAGSYYKIPILQGYTPIILSAYDWFASLTNLNSPFRILTKIQNIDLESSVLDFLGAKYVLDQRIKNEDRADVSIPLYFQKVYESEAVTLYENPHAMPRFFLVREVVKAQNRGMVAALIKEKKVDLSTTAILTKDDSDSFVKSLKSDLKKCKNPKDIGTVILKNYRANTINLSVSLDCQGLLVTSEPWFPGWEAKIDGKKTPVYRANLAFRSVVVPEGEHTVEFYYSPKIYLYSAGVSGVSLFVFLFILWNFRMMKMIEEIILAKLPTWEIQTK